MIEYLEKQDVDGEAAIVEVVDDAFAAGIQGCRNDDDSRRLHSMLIGSGIVPQDAGAHFAIPVDLGRAAAARVRRIVKMSQLPEVLNCTRPMVEQLCNERVLTPVY